MKWVWLQRSKLLCNFLLLSSTHKCNLSVRPFAMVVKLAKKYSGEVRMPSFFLGLLFNLFRMKIIERTVLRTFSLGKSPINPHVKIFSYAPLFLFFDEVFAGLSTSCSESEAKKSRWGLSFRQRERFLSDGIGSEAPISLAPLSHEWYGCAK